MGQHEETKGTPVKKLQFQITPENGLLKAYRALKGVQLRFLELIRDTDGQENISKEIASTRRLDGDLDLCPIGRFMLLWVPLFCICVVGFALFAWLLVWGLLTVATQPTQSNLAVFGGVSLLVLGTTFAILLVFGGVYFSSTILPRFFPKKEPVVMIAAKEGPGPMTRASQAIGAWLTTQHEKYCIRLKVVAK